MGQRRHKTIGYLRVSTVDQDIEKNKTDILKLANAKDLGLDKYRPEIEALLANGSTQKFIASRYGTTEANLHHWMKRHSLTKAKG